VHSADAATSKRPRQQFTLGSSNALSQLSIFMRTDGKRRFTQDEGGVCLSSGHGLASEGGAVAITQEGFE
jgi:hypothetical protein